MRPLKAVFLQIAIILVACAAIFPLYAQDSAPPELSFVDGNGSARTLSEFRGKFVLLNVWATWCAPCVAEMPALARLSKDFSGRGITVIALSADSSVETVKTFYRARRIEGLDVYQDRDMQAISSLGLGGLPTTLFLDPQGKEMGRYAGFTNWDDDKTREALSKMIGSDLPASSSNPGPKIITF